MDLIQHFYSFIDLFLTVKKAPEGGWGSIADRHPPHEFVSVLSIVVTRKFKFWKSPAWVKE